MTRITKNTTFHVGKHACRPERDRQWPYTVMQCECSVPESEQRGTTLSGNNHQPKSKPCHKQNGNISTNLNCSHCVTSQGVRDWPPTSHSEQSKRSCQTNTLSRASLDVMEAQCGMHAVSSKEVFVSIDEAAQEGLRVKRYLLWSRSCHCCGLHGARRQV